MQRSLLFIACLLFCATIVAQQYPFVHYTPREGLANNRAKFIFQDSKGKLYISTYSGLSIYDGARFINYNTNNGLAAGLVNDIVEMGPDSVWIILNANRLHAIVNGRLKNISTADNYIPIINQLIRCSNGKYYALADEGFFRWEKQRFNRINLKPANRTDSLTSLIQAREAGKKLFMLSNPGYASPYNGNLAVYDLKQEKLIAFKSDLKATYLFSPDGKELWVTTINGLFLLDTNALKKKEIKLLPLPLSASLPPNVIPQNIYVDRQKNNWISTAEGVYRIDINGKRLLFTTNNGLTTNLQTSIFQDFENNIWFTNEQTGVSKLSNQQMEFYKEYRPSFTATDISESFSGDSVWLYDGYRNKVILVEGNNILEYKLNSSVSHLGKFIDAGNQFLFSGQEIYRWNASASGQYHLSRYYNDSNSTVGFNSALVDKRGNLVAASTRLVVVSGNKTLSYPLEYIADQVSIDQQERIWVATRSNRLFCFRITGFGKQAKLDLLQEFNNLPPMSPRSITIGKDGKIWIGSRDHGLFCFYYDGNTLKFLQQLTTKEGLTENFVNYLFCDRDNDIWVCTPSGLDKLRIVNRHLQIENVTRSKNLFLPISKIRQTSSGEFWILSTAGILIYKPGLQKEFEWTPKLTFSDIYLSNDPQMLVSQGQELSHLQNNIVFRLAAPSYMDEKQTRFSYKLEGGGNDSWTVPTTNAEVNFLNLPPGNYTMHAKAVFLHGLYPESKASFSFSILPPWWQTTWFRILAMLTLIILTLLAIRYYVKRKLQLQRIILEKERAIEKERTRIATDMHDDLGAGLSKIRFLSETIGMKKQQHLPIEEEITSIRSYSHEMIDKMGEIVWALNEKNDTLSDLLSYTRAYAVEYLEQNGIKAHVTEPDIIPQLNVNGEFRRNIFLTVKEALHNIVKHAEATEVWINIEIDSFLRIRLTDNGKGIDQPGMAFSGNGLYNMNKRIQELKGEFSVEEKNGTVVAFQVPLPA